MANLRVDKITSTETFDKTGSVQFDGVDDEIIFALNLWPKFKLIVSKNLIKLHMEPHELCKRLLAEKPLCLKVHLRNRLAGEAARPKKCHEMV